jgi:ATP-dependent Clp protease adaptor protein ClpS
MSTDLATDTMTKLKVPSLYKVVLLNDDYTPMEFVIQILMEVFNKNPHEAYQLAMDVHKQGRGIAGTYSKEVAEQKVLESNMTSKKYKHPFKTISELA